MIPHTGLSHVKENRIKHILLSNEMRSKLIREEDNSLESRFVVENTAEVQRLTQQTGLLELRGSVSTTYDVNVTIVTRVFV